jgi:hypothetical protein
MGVNNLWKVSIRLFLELPFSEIGQTIAPAGERKTLSEYSLAYKNGRKFSKDRLLCLGVDMR